MIIPGLSSARVPIRARLMLSVVVSAVMAVSGGNHQVCIGGNAALCIGLIPTELLSGLLLGLSGRLYVAALEFAITAVSNYIGLSSLGASLDRDEPLASMATLITGAATLVLLSGNYHHYVLIRLLDIYDSRLIADDGGGARVRQIAQMMQRAFESCLIMTSPLVAYGLMVNLAFAILGKGIIQLPTFFISVPLLALGGLALMGWISQDLLRTFVMIVLEDSK